MIEIWIRSDIKSIGSKKKIYYIIYVEMVNIYYIYLIKNIGHCGKYDLLKYGCVFPVHEQDVILET